MLESRFSCLDPLTFVGMEDLLHSYDLSFVEGRRETISFGFFWRYGPSIYPFPSAHCGDYRDALKGHNHQGCIQNTLPLKAFYGLGQECYILYETRFPNWFHNFPQSIMWIVALKWIVVRCCKWIVAAKFRKLGS